MKTKILLSILIVCLFPISCFSFSSYNIETTLLYAALSEKFIPYFENKKYDEGIKEIQKIISTLSPDNKIELAAYYTTLALFYAESGDETTAYSYIDKSTSLDPKSVFTFGYRMLIGLNENNADQKYKICMHDMQKLDEMFKDTGIQLCNAAYSSINVLSVVDFYTMYKKDPVSLLTKYHDMPITIKGKILLVDLFFQQDRYVFMKPISDDSCIITFQFRESESSEISTLKNGDEISIMGTLLPFLPNGQIMIDKCQIAPEF